MLLRKTVGQQLFLPQNESWVSDWLEHLEWSSNLRPCWPRWSQIFVGKKSRHCWDQKSRQCLDLSTNCRQKEREKWNRVWFDNDRRTLKVEQVSSWKKCWNKNRFRKTFYHSANAVMLQRITKNWQCFYRVCSTNQQLDFESILIGGHGEMFQLCF